MFDRTGETDSIINEMDFRSINKFNAFVNALSGNFLPLDHEKRSLGFVCTTYMIFTWCAKFIFLSTTFIGLRFHESAVMALHGSGVSTLVCLETLVVNVYMNSRRKYLRDLIRKFNSVLIDSDDMRQLIRDIVDPPMKRLKMYTIAAICSPILWVAMPVARITETDQFTYTDFKAPTYLPGAPFTVTTFVCGLLVEMIGVGCLVLKKINIDVYMSHFITLLTAEYQYVGEQITSALCQESSEKEEKLVLLALRKSVRHHSIVIEIGQMVTKLLYVNVGVTYLGCILRFCILGYGFITISGVYEKSMYLMFAIGSLIQVYILCSCIQELLDASTSITDEAFHENWHERGNAVKSIFRTILLGNRMECRLTAYRTVDLTIPTFASIINQAYTCCLLLLRIK